MMRTHSSGRKAGPWQGGLQLYRDELHEQVGGVPLFAKDLLSLRVERETIDAMCERYIDKVVHSRSGAPVTIKRDNSSVIFPLFGRRIV